MAVPVSELQKINPSNVIELFQLQLDNDIHGSTTTYYFHNGTSDNNNANIIFNNCIIIYIRHRRTKIIKESCIIWFTKR